jgi:hypothetical protein
MRIEDYDYHSLSGLDAESSCEYEDFGYHLKVLLFNFGRKTKNHVSNNFSYSDRLSVGSDRKLMYDRLSNESNFRVGELFPTKKSS